MPKRGSRTLGEVAIVNLCASEEYGGKGIRGQVRAAKHAANAVATIVCLAIAAERGASPEGWPTQHDYADYWDITDRQAQREWQLVKRAFPGEDGPNRLAKLLAIEYRARVAEGVGAVLSLPADKLLITA